MVSCSSISGVFDLQIFLASVGRMSLTYAARQMMRNPDRCSARSPNWRREVAQSVVNGDGGGLFRRGEANRAFVRHARFVAWREAHICAEIPVAANAARNRADVKWDKSVRAQAATQKLAQCESQRVLLRQSAVF